MTEQPDFDRNMPQAARIERLSPLVQRVIAPNPGPFTFTGTCTYIIGDRDMIVIDPGPDDPAHRDLVMKAIGTSRLNAILVTHTHRDHSPLAKTLKSLTGAPLMGCGPHQLARTLNEGEINPLDASSDYDYRPDLILNDGERMNFGDIEIEMLATPGHTINHLAFALLNETALFSGDHVMGWSTSIVAPPDGAMQPYLHSLEKLITRDDQVYYPGHGEAVRNPRALCRNFLHIVVCEKQAFSNLCAMVSKQFPISSQNFIAVLTRVYMALRVSQSLPIWKILYHADLYKRRPLYHFQQNFHRVDLRICERDHFTKHGRQSLAQRSIGR